MYRRVLLVSILLISPFAHQAADATTLRDVLDRGVLKVGVKTDYPPFGFVHSREPTGFEPALARDLAELLGVELEMVEVSAANRFEKLLDDEIDVIVATVSDTEERRRMVRIVDPAYYSSGTAILSRRSAGFGSWDDLNGMPVCGVEGAFYNDRVVGEFGAELLEFATPVDMLGALDQEFCWAAVYDAAYLQAQIATGDWPEFEMPLHSIDVEYWGIVVHPEARALAALVSGAIVEWHIDGRLRRLEDEYELPSNPFVDHANEQFRAINPSIGRGRRP